MKRAIRTHARDFVAIVVLLVLAGGIAAYILGHQPAFTVFKSFYVVKADFASAAAVSPGQGEAVTIAGVPVGTVGAVTYTDGHAVVTMDIDQRYAPIYQNATVLLRERTPLKDMYLSLDPGSAVAGKVPDNGSLGLGQTEPDVDVDQILGSLDADTRTYLELALSGGAEALRGPNAAALRAVFERFPPLVHSTAQFSSALAQRSGALAGAIHNLDLVATSLGRVNTELSTLVTASDQDFGAIASQDSALSGALSEAPATLNTTATALSAVSRFGAAATPALDAITPFAHDLAPALVALRPLARDTEPEIEHQLIPFSTAITPLARALAPAAAHLSAAVPPLTTGVRWVNALLNALAHEPARADNDSYLFWGAWLAHNADSALSLQDADGAVLRSQFMATCPALNLLENVLTKSTPSIASILALLNIPQSSSLNSSYCPAASL